MEAFCRERNSKFHVSYSSNSVRQKLESLTCLISVYRDFAMFCFRSLPPPCWSRPDQQGGPTGLQALPWWRLLYRVPVQVWGTQFTNPRKWTVFMGHNLHGKNKALPGWRLLYRVSVQVWGTQFIKSRKWTVFMGPNLHWENSCFIEANQWLWKIPHH